VGRLSQEGFGFHHKAQTRARTVTGNFPPSKEMHHQISSSTVKQGIVQVKNYASPLTVYQGVPAPNGFFFKHKCFGCSALDHDIHVYIKRKMMGPKELGYGLCSKYVSQIRQPYHFEKIAVENVAGYFMLVQ
jgi:hypothetical protein